MFWKSWWGTFHRHCDHHGEDGERQYNVAHCESKSLRIHEGVTQIWNHTHSTDFLSNIILNYTTVKIPSNKWHGFANCSMHGVGNWRQSGSTEHLKVLKEQQIHLYNWQTEIYRSKMIVTLLIVTLMMVQTALPEK